MIALGSLYIIFCATLNSYCDLEILLLLKSYFKYRYCAAQCVFPHLNVLTLLVIYTPVRKTLMNF